MGAPSNMTLMKMFGDFQKDTPEERNVRFGVREHGMGAICNGMILHGSGIIPYCATFFIFSDYMRAGGRGEEGPRRFHAVHGALRRAERRVQGEHPARRVLRPRV